MSELILLRGLLESLMIANSVGRLRLLSKLPDIADAIKPQTIFDFDLRCTELADVNNLMIVNLLKARSDFKEERVMKKNIRKNLLPNLSHVIKSDDDRDFLTQYGVHFMQIYNLNSVALQNRDRLDGFGVLPFGSLINHSCDPNIIGVNFDNKFACVVVKPIAKDAQLLFNYG